jgi:hypothetical protein
MSTQDSSGKVHTFKVGDRVVYLGRGATKPDSVGEVKSVDWCRTTGRPWCYAVFGQTSVYDDAHNFAISSSLPRVRDITEAKARLLKRLGPGLPSLVTLVEWAAEEFAGVQAEPANVDDLLTPLDEALRLNFAPKTLDAFGQARTALEPLLARVKPDQTAEVLDRAEAWLKEHLAWGMGATGRAFIASLRAALLPPAFELPPPGTEFTCRFNDGPLLTFYRFSSGRIMQQGGRDWSAEEFITSGASIATQTRAAESP